jgi:hypothetical protein
MPALARLRQEGGERGSLQYRLAPAQAYSVECAQSINYRQQLLARHRAGGTLWQKRSIGAARTALQAAL